MGQRGQLTPQINEKAKTLLGREITQVELRLMPYVHYQAMNDMNIDPNKINTHEREVLKQWKEEGYVTAPASGLSISKAFYDAMNELLWLAYVDYDSAA